ncbi:MAG: hypothetical protein JST04_08645 [Bdellovibrionales bacterium]|nr:hypothetical protein [Bdellovibrionales bacterium]
MRSKTFTAQILTVVLALGAAAVSACNFQYAKEDGDSQQFAQQDAVGYDLVNAEVFQPKCLGCHSNDKPLLTSYEAVVANIRAIEEEALVRHTMPKSGPLPTSLQAMLRRWIQDGTPRAGPAPVPQAPAAASLPRPYTFANLKKDVLDAKCNNCHATGNRDGITALDTYADFMSVQNLVKPVVLGFDGKDVVPEEDLMPPVKSDVKLADAEKALILLWYGDGMLEKKPKTPKPGASSKPQPEPSSVPAPNPSEGAQT